MSFDLNQYRAAIGLFNTRSNRSHYQKPKKLNYDSIFLFLVAIIILSLTNLNISILLTTIYHSRCTNCIISNDLMFILSLNALLIDELLMRSGDVHKNPGPDDKSKLSLCQCK